jgi:hypothetical protein
VTLLGSSSFQIQEDALMAICFLCDGNVHNQVKAVAAGAIPPMVMLLGSSNVAVEEEAARAPFPSCVYADMMRCLGAVSLLIQLAAVLKFRRMQ